MWPLLSLTAFLEPEVRDECWVRTSVPAHPKGCCCGAYKGTTSPHTPRTYQGMVLWGLQRYYLSLDNLYNPRDAAVGFTKVLPLPRQPVHPKGCCCRVYKGTTSPPPPPPPTPCTPQRMLLWGSQRYYLSPHTPRDAAVGFTKVLPLPTHPKGCFCGVHKGTTSPHTPQGMLLWGLQRYYLSPHTPRDAAVGFTEVLPLPRHPKGCCCGVYKGTTSPHTPRTPQGMLVWGLQRYYLSPHTQGMLLWGLQRYYLSPHTLRDAAVGFTKVLPLPTRPHTPRCSRGRDQKRVC